jgi:hypothetical protein
VKEQKEHNAAPYCPLPVKAAHGEILLCTTEQRYLRG